MLYEVITDLALTVICCMQSWDAKPLIEHDVAILAGGGRLPQRSVKCAREIIALSLKEKTLSLHVITSYSIHYTKLYE